uniref:Cysteine-rich rehydration-responsive 1 n=1 Tax=Linderniella brevidens TaxID=263965 RepID=A0A097HTN9_9LAMI|nr:cysteine-rich rehydration-responsive 1 [Linderniella brevidens]
MASNCSKVVLLLLVLLAATPALFALSQAAAHEIETETSITIEPSELSKAAVAVSDAVSSSGMTKFLDYIKSFTGAGSEVLQICMKAPAEACPCGPGGGFACRACCRIKGEVPKTNVPVNRLKILQFIQNCRRFRSTCQQPLGEICRRAAIGCPCRGRNDLKCVVCCGIRG